EPCSQMSSSTSLGTRSAIAARAASLLPAVRASWPSSLRIPATSSRISSSSSTTRMSDAIVDLFRSTCSLAHPCPASPLIGCCRQQHSHHCAYTAVEGGWSVVQLQPAAMVLDDLLDDSEPQAGALLARRHVRLEQPLPVLARQALAIVHHADLDHPARLPRSDADHAHAVGLARCGIDCFGGVLDDVAEGLTHQPCIEASDQRLIAQIVLYRDVGTAHLDQEGCLTQRLAQIELLHIRLGHARKSGELVHH